MGPWVPMDMSPAIRDPNRGHLLGTVHKDQGLVFLLCS